MELSLIPNDSDYSSGSKVHEAKGRFFKANNNKKYISIFLLAVFFFILLFLIFIIVTNDFLFNQSNKKGKDNQLNRDLTYITLNDNEKFNRPLSDTNKYELIELDNHLEVLLISNSNAVRSGFSLAIDIIDFKGRYELNKNYAYFDNFAQYYITSLTLEAGYFSKELGRDGGNFRFIPDNNNNIHSFYCDVDNNGLETSLKFFHEMFYKNNLVSTIEHDVDSLELSSSKSLYDKYFEPQLKGKYNNRFVKIINLMSKGEKVNKEENISLNEYMREIIKLGYNNTQNSKLTVISNYTISELKSIVIPIFENSISRGGRKESQVKSVKNAINNKFIYHSKSTYSTLDLIIPCIQDVDVNIYQYVIYMINDVGEHSLWSILKGKDLINKLNARLETVDKAIHYLLITLKLTTTGSKEVEYIIRAIGGFFTEGYNYEKYEITYKDLKTIFHQKFNFKTVDKFQQYLIDVTSRGGSIQRKDINNLLDNAELPEYSYTKIKEVLKTISNPSSFSFFVGFNSLLDISTTLKQGGFTEYMYDSVKYYTKSINLIEGKPDTTLKFEFRGANKYISQARDINQVDSLYFQRNIFDYQPLLYELNETIHENEGWYRNDQCFKNPRIEAYFHFTYAKIGNFHQINQLSYISDYFNAMEVLFFNRVKRIILTRLISAEEAGNEIKLSLNRGKGFTFQVSSYSDTGVKIISDVFHIIYDSKQYSDLSFSDYEPITYDTANEKFIDYGFYYEEDTMKYTHEAKKLGAREKGKIAEPKTILPKYSKAGEDFYNYLFKPEAKIKSLLYGDIGGDDSIRRKIGEIIKEYNTKSNFIENKSTSYDPIYQEPESHYGRCYILQYNNTFWGGDKKEHFMMNAFSLGNRTASVEVMSDLLISSFKGIFKNRYDMSSTIPFVEKVYLDNDVYLKLVKTSSVVFPNVMYDETTNDLFDFYNKIRNITNEKFELMKEYLIKKNKQLPINGKEKAAKVWHEIFEESDYFDFGLDYQQVLYSIKRIDFISIVKDVLTRNFYLSFQFFADKSYDDLDSGDYLYNHFREKICKIKKMSNFAGWGENLYESLDDIYGNS